MYVPMVVDFHAGEVLDDEFALNSVMHEPVLEENGGKRVALGKHLFIDTHDFEFDYIGHAL